MDDTENLKLPYLMPSQAQKHVTHNEALRMLDALVHLAVLDRDLTVPPPAPAEGERHIVAAAATGAWAGRDGEVAAWQDGAWAFYAPREGWLAWIGDEALLCRWTGTAWQDTAASIDVLQGLSLLGVGTTADATNPFAARLNKALWTALPLAEGGDGDLRYTLNKEAAGDVLSLLMQSGFSGRAELGLIGDDDLTLKVSADGATWKTALGVDRATGAARFLAGSVSVASASTCDIGAAAALGVTITGTTAISSFGTAPNVLRLVTFESALALGHNATSLMLPTGATIVTAAGDTALATSDNAGNWRVRAYQRASGKALAASVGDLSGGPVGGRRNAFINPFFDVAQAYAGAFTFGSGGGHLPVDMVRAAGTTGGGSWQGQLLSFTPGQVDVPGNPDRYLSITELAPNDNSGFPGLLFVLGPVSTLAGQQVTASFYARAASALGLVFSFVQHFGTGGSTTIYGAGGSSPAVLTTSWQRFAHTLTLPSMSGKTIGSGNYLALQVIRTGSPKTFGADFCGIQVERGGMPTELNALGKMESEALCRNFFEKLSVRSNNGTQWVGFQPKSQIPSVTASAGTIANVTRAGCQVIHNTDAAVDLSIDSRL